MYLNFIYNQSLYFNCRSFMLVDGRAPIASIPSASSTSNSPLPVDARPIPRPEAPALSTSQKMKNSFNNFVNNHGETLGIILIISAVALTILAVGLFAASSTVGLIVPGALAAVPLLVCGIALFTVGGTLIMRSVDEESPMSLVRDGRVRIPFVNERPPTPVSQLMVDYIAANFTMQEPVGGGNCMFDSAAVLLRRLAREERGEYARYNSISHRQVRAAIVSYMRENRFQFERFLVPGTNWERYLNYISRVNMWGGDTELTALVSYMEMQGTPIQIRVWDIHNTNITPLQIGTYGPILNLRRVPDHFQILIPRT